MTTDLISLVAAMLLGGLVGLDRELRGYWAGLRTHVMVALGAALFVAVGPRDGSFADVSRVIQGVAAGVGFIGAGTILKLTDQQEVKGLTTASSIWLAAAIGVACGMRHYELAVAAAISAVLVLGLLRRLETHLGTSDSDKKEDPKH
jgi:putative Mg2+ transporter-C (MgtC) family protein